MVWRGLPENPSGNKLQTGRYILEKPLWIARTRVSPNVEKEPLYYPKRRQPWMAALLG